MGFSKRTFFNQGNNAINNEPITIPSTNSDKVYLIHSFATGVSIYTGQNQTGQPLALNTDYFVHDDTTKSVFVDAQLQYYKQYITFSPAIIASLSSGATVYGNYTGGGDVIDGEVATRWDNAIGDLYGSYDVDYGGAKSKFHVANTEGDCSLTIKHNETSNLATPRDSIRIYRTINSGGGTSWQQGGAIVRSTLQANCNHHEFGYFSVMDSYSINGLLEHVGMYSQATSLGSGASPLWGAVFEVRDIRPDGQGTAVDHSLCGIEVDVATNKAFSDTHDKIGVECIAYGGGEATDAFAVYAGYNTRGNGTYYSGHFRYGLRMLENSLHETEGIGFYVKTSQKHGIKITGKSSDSAISLQADQASPVGIDIGDSYSVPIAIQAKKEIRLNGSGNNQGISYDNDKGAILFDALGFGLVGANTYTSASAGGITLPTAAGLVDCWVNGCLQKMAYYNA